MKTLLLTALLWSAAVVSGQEVPTIQPPNPSCIIKNDLRIRTFDGIDYNLNDHPLAGVVQCRDLMSYKLGRAFHFHIRTSAEKGGKSTMEAISLAALLGDSIEIDFQATPTLVLYNGQDVTGQSGPFTFWGYEMTVTQEHGGDWETVYYMPLDDQDYVRIIEDKHGRVVLIELKMPQRSEGLCGPGVFGRDGQAAYSGAAMAEQWRLQEGDPKFFSFPMADECNPPQTEF